MAKRDSLDRVGTDRPTSPRKPEKKTSIATRMTGTNTKTSVFSIRVTEEELLEMNQLADLLKQYTRSGSRNNILRACFRAMKNKKTEQLVKLVKELP